MAAISFDPDLAATTQDCVRARFVSRKGDRIPFAEFGDQILTKLLRTLPGCERLNIDPSDWIGGRRLRDERGSEDRALERKTDDPSEPEKVHGRDYPPK